MARKPRIDSTAEIVRIMTAAAKEIVPPASVPLDADDMVFFNKVIAEFARSELTEHKIELVAFLARTMSDLKREQDALREEGSTLESDKGITYANPRIAFVQKYTQSIINLRRSLLIHGRAADGEKRSLERLNQVVKRRQEAKAIERDSPLVEDLISRPK